MNILQVFVYSNGCNTTWSKHTLQVPVATTCFQVQHPDSNINHKPDTRRPTSTLHLGDTLPALLEQTCFQVQMIRERIECRDIKFFDIRLTKGLPCIGNNLHEKRHTSHKARKVG
jgi:hypothetical protein